MMFGYNHTKRSEDAYKSTAAVFRNRKKIKNSIKYERKKHRFFS